MELFKPKASPCDICPYHLGLIQTFVSPCPTCKANGYRTQALKKLLEQLSQKRKKQGAN